MQPSLWLVLQCLLLSHALRSLKHRATLKPVTAAFSLGEEQIAVIILAGGKGKRMKSAMPKQFLPLLGRPVFLRSLDVFTALDCVSSIVIVLDESFRVEYEAVASSDARIRWADPGTERQDSVYNALQQVPSSSTIVAVHDAARPMVTKDEVERVFTDCIIHGAAVLGVPMKATVKESEDGQFVLRTVPRSRLWEVHTPQVIRKQLLIDGFKMVKEKNLEITDDVSVIEAIGLPVKLTLGEYTNIKLTTPDDLSIAEQILRERGIKDESGIITSTIPEDIKYGCNSIRYRENLSGANPDTSKKYFGNYKAHLRLK
jgi:2-C-methyl-D-erythritol 4-phosphate cytidylyltransferase